MSSNKDVIPPHVLVHTNEVQDERSKVPKTSTTVNYDAIKNPKRRLEPAQQALEHHWIHKTKKEPKKTTLQHQLPH